LLHIHLHHFHPNGVSGVAVLAESHISVHTWPDIGYAPLDLFMCGEAIPDACIPVLRRAFKAKRVEINQNLRGPGTRPGAWRGSAACALSHPAAFICRPTMAERRRIPETLFDDLGFRMTYEVKRVLYEVQTEHHHLVLFKHPFFGKMLMLDGATQVTTADE